MGYRDSNAARRAEIESLHDRLKKTEHEKLELHDRAESTRSRLSHRLDRAERALVSLRGGHGVVGLMARPWMTTVLVLTTALFAFAIVLRAEHLPYHADAFAKASIAIGIFATLGGWRAAGQLQVGIVVMLIKAFLAGLAMDHLLAFGPPLGPRSVVFFYGVPSLIVLSVFLERFVILRFTDPD